MSVKGVPGVRGANGRRRGGEGNDGGLTPSTHPSLEKYQILFTALAVWYVLLSLLMIVLSWTAPGINFSGSIVFSLLSVIVLIASVLQLVYRNQLVAYICGECSPVAGYD
jgi:hypothetical protein